MKAVLVVGVILVYTRITLSQDQDRDPCKRYDVDGCSVPTFLPVPYKKFFDPACDRHDVCYLCGHRFGISREKCDSSFLDGMIQLCQQLDAELLRIHFETDSRKYCEAVAYIYYGAVRLFADCKYRIPSAGYCDESWVQPCLPKKLILSEFVETFTSE